MAVINSGANGLWAEQDKDAFLDYSLDWSDWLSSGDSISSSTWTADVALTLNSMSVNGSFTYVWVQGGVAGVWYALTNSVISAQGRKDQRTVRLLITDEVSLPANRTALFPNIALAVAALRRDGLMLAGQSLLPAVTLDDDYLATKIKSAEADAARRLRVLFQPTTVFAGEPSAEEITAIGSDPWIEEAAYDYEPGLWNTEDWGYLVLRNDLVSRVDSVEFVYPSPAAAIFRIPDEWIRLDKKAGHIRFVPSGSVMHIVSFSAMMMTMMARGRDIPQMIRIRYVSGISNAERDYPDLIDLVKKMAILRIINDAFIPQSGSISADGLSESFSADMDKYSTGVDSMLRTLRDSIHGVQCMVM